MQERLQLSRKRALYLPSIALSGSASRVLGKYDVPSNLSQVENKTTWDIGLGLKYSLFQGQQRKNQILQSKLNIEQLGYSKSNLENQLELRIRSNMEAVGASYSQMQLSQTAAEASNKNYAIVQNAYQEGQTNIVTLIDAQNNALFSELSAINAVYTFVIDFLTLERSIGFYNFLATPPERASFFEKATQYITQK